MPFKNELYDIGFSQNYCFPNIAPLFCYGLYVNILRESYVSTFSKFFLCQQTGRCFVRKLAKAFLNDVSRTIVIFYLFFL